jgi:uncharacterized iron-regulated membrane protein
MTETDDKPAMPKAPKGLRSAGRRFWREIHATYAFPAAPEMIMLVEDAARTADVVARLQAIVDNADTLRTTGSRGQAVGIPELDLLKAYRAQFAALVKQLDLPGADDEDAPAGRTTPMTRSEAGRKAASARWDHRYEQR